jgi:hypothetical protein
VAWFIEPILDTRTCRCLPDLFITEIYIKNSNLISVLEGRFGWRRIVLLEICKKTFVIILLMHHSAEVRKIYLAILIQVYLLEHVLEVGICHHPTFAFQSFL